MPQRFLSIKNFEKYQTSTQASSKPWIKLYKCVLGDPEFLKLSPPYRFLYIGLLILADECGNKIYNDPTYLRQRLYIPETLDRHLLDTSHTHDGQKAYTRHTDLDLKPLYRAGFLVVSNKHRVLSEKSREEKNRVEESRGEPPAPIPLNGHHVKREVTPLPEEWSPKENHLRFALARQLDLHIEAAHFRGKAMENEWKTKDWDRKFSNWMLQEVKFRQRRTG